MIIQKNKKTGEVKKVNCPQGDDWEMASKSESETLELNQEKNKLISDRKSKRAEIFREWFDDLENMPEDVKEESRKMKREIGEIEIANKKNINNYI
jgi:hypothetical protein